MSAQAPRRCCRRWCPPSAAPVAAAALIAAQGVLTGVGYGCVFRLQTTGGPIHLCQMSHVKAAFGMALSAVLMDETAESHAVIGAVVILVGVVVAGPPPGRPAPPVTASPP